MSNVEIKLNSAGVRSLLKSQEMRQVCNEQANKIASTAGNGYEVQERTYEARVGAIIKPVTYEAIRDNSDNNTLLKVMNS